MKKIISILFVVLSLFVVSGCKNNSENNSEDNTKFVIMSDGGKIYVRKFIFENHQYIEFKDYRYYGHGYVHDPDCWCMIDYD